MPAHLFSGLRLDEVCYLGKVRFLIPHHWIEKSEEDHGCFSEKGTKSGWLRVSIITVKSPGKATQQRVLALLRRDLPRQAKVYAVADQAPEGGRHLVEDVFRVKLYAMFFQQRQKFLLEVPFLVMLGLILDVFGDRG